MPRPPAAKKGEKTKTFTVSPGYSIGGFDGKRKDGGDAIELTHAQAKYYMEMGAIKLELPDFGEDAPEPDAGDPAKTGSGPETEGSGEPDAGGAPSGDDDETKGTAASRRKKADL